MKNPQKSKSFVSLKARPVFIVLGVLLVFFGAFFSFSSRGKYFTAGLSNNQYVPNIAPGSKITINFPLLNGQKKIIQICPNNQVCRKLAETSSWSVSALIPSTMSGNATILVSYSADKLKPVSSANVKIIRGETDRVVTILPNKMPDQVYFNDPMAESKKGDISVSGDVSLCNSCPCPTGIEKFSTVPPDPCSAPEFTDGRLATFKNPPTITTPDKISIKMFYPKSGGKNETRPAELIKYICDDETDTGSIIGCGDKSAMGCYVEGLYSIDPDFSISYILSDVKNCSEKKMYFGPFKIKDCAGNMLNKSGAVATVFDEKCGSPVDVKTDNPAEIDILNFTNDQFTILEKWNPGLSTAYFAPALNSQEWQKRMSSLKNVMNSIISHEKKHAQHYYNYQIAGFQLAQNISGMVSGITVDKSSDPSCSEKLADWLIQETWSKKDRELYYDNVVKPGFELDCYVKDGVSGARINDGMQYFCAGKNLEIDYDSGTWMNIEQCNKMAEKFSDRNKYVGAEMKKWYAENPKPDCPPACGLDKISQTACQQLSDIATSALGTMCGDEKYNPNADINKNKFVTPADAGSVINHKNANDELWCQQQLSDSASPCS